jgi:hypothetical protein
MEQQKLFDDLDDKYEIEWKGMPEFNMTPEIPLLTIKVSFKTKEDIGKFSELIGQKVSFTMENYWFPKLNRNAFSELKYYDNES